MHARKSRLASILAFSLIFMSAGFAQAADTDDGISEFTEGSISSEDNLGSKDTNINFIVTDAIAKAKVMQNKSGDIDGAKGKGNRYNLEDGETENNENSVVLGPGSKADKIYNIVIEK